ncbi:hypothetical protein MLD38_011144 [Melastoma candidum]|uniref:Uncharacterized protein n=1 Tax=Melastoma candidum TaxID=119954 RepID=A0ACB9RAF3_9MYRT|nr:hypothetical protein MLD38_011144 [Melastoma candidum]
MTDNNVKLLLPLLLVYLSRSKTITAAASSSSSPPPPPSSPYLFASTFAADYSHMLSSFKIFIYNTTDPSSPPRFASPAQSLFYDCLLRSPFVTLSADDAHLFFVPFSSATSLSNRALARLVTSLKSSLPYWNRTLGSDHFYLSCHGLAFSSDRGLLELKKNSIQVSCFPANRFIPHKDVTLVPRAESSPGESVTARVSREYLAYARFGAVKNTGLLDGLRKDEEFLVESQPSDEVTWRTKMGSSELCLFEYGEGDFTGLSEAMRFGCVPTVITNRPMNDLPLIDVLSWREIGAFVGKDPERLRTALGDVAREGRKMDRMRRLGAQASRHLSWNEAPQPLDAFHMVMYQLWIRRHTTRYVRRPELAP